MREFQARLAHIEREVRHGILVLSGLAAYVISEQNKPSRTAVKAVFDTFSVAMVGAYFCTARIIWVARRKRRSKVSDDDPPA